MGQDPPGREEGFAAAQTFGELRFYRMLRDAESLRDLTLGKIFDLAEDKHGAAAFRQRLDRVR
jgi:hypothetical protein